jgi:hypothetical protein
MTTPPLLVGLVVLDEQVQHRLDSVRGTLSLLQDLLANSQSSDPLPVSANDLALHFVLLARELEAIQGMSQPIDEVIAANAPEIRHFAQQVEEV